MKRESIPLTVRIPIRNRSGEVVGEKEVASYAGLLAKAHEEGLSGITTEVVQVPTTENGEVAIVRAHVITSRGTFTGIGDASPGNVGSRIVPHLLRMAETRAKARALRDAVNIGVVSMEELGEDLNGDAREHALSEEQQVVSPPAPGRHVATPRSPRPRNGRSSRAATTVQPARGDAAPVHAERSEGLAASSGGAGTSNAAGPQRRESSSEHALSMSEAQRRYLFRLASDLGIEGDAARGFLLEALQVDDFKQVSRQAASALIDRLRQQVDAGSTANAQQGGQGNGSAPPF